MKRRVLVTGGAGFVGATLAVQHRRQHPEDVVIAFDNLKRRGSELAILRLAEAGVEFVHGDVRCPEDLEAVGPVDLVVECSAEASALSGYGGDPRYLIHTNLAGTINCLEIARRWRASVIFLSTSRVYAISALRALPLEQRNDRWTIPADAAGTGWSAAGITTGFSIDGARSLYGTTKLCSELLIEEYRQAYGIKAVVDRCGVITGPWQFGHVEQGFVALWAARHWWGGRLTYRGFDGEGFQVRDILHVDDLSRLVERQIEQMDRWNGEVFNVGGGLACSVSLKELTARCARRGRCEVVFDSSIETHPADIPYYVTDNTEVTRKTGWSPQRSVGQILDDLFSWFQTYGDRLSDYF